MLNGLVVTSISYTCDVARPDGKVFRIEIHRHEDDAPMHVVEHEVKVFRLSYPVGFMKMDVKEKDADPKFRQFWMYLEDFPKVSTEGFTNTIRDRVIEQILKLKY